MLYPTIALPSCPKTLYQRSPQKNPSAIRQYQS